MLTNIKAVVAPVGQSNERPFGIVYILINSFTFVLVALSFKPKYGIQKSLYAGILMMFQISFRQLDLEKSYEEVG